MRISERIHASLTRARILWSRVSTSEVDRSLLSWDGMVEWGLGSECTALGSDEWDRWDRFVADWLRSWKRLLASEEDDLLRPVAGTDKVDLS